MTRLSGLDRAQLNADDTSLRDAAMAVGSIVSARNTSDGSGGDHPSASNDPSIALIDRAHTALDGSDALLKDQPK